MKVADCHVRERGWWGAQADKFSARNLDRLLRLTLSG